MKKSMFKTSDNEIPQKFQKTEIGLIPKDWKIDNLASICKINPKSPELEDSFVYVDLECVEKGILKTKNIINKVDAPSRAKRVLELNDILYQLVRPYQKNNFIYIEKEPIQVVASTGYAQIRTQYFDFVYHLINSDYFNKQVLIKCSGSNYPAITSEDLKKIKVCFPTLEEQQKIAEILSTQDKVIELKEKLISEKQRQKKYLMQQLLTGKMRLKRFNEKWNVLKVGDICEFVRNGYAYTPVSQKAGVKITRIETISERTINIDNVGYAHKSIDEKYLLKKGDILFSHINSLSQIGKTAFFDTDEKLYHGMNLLCIRANSKVIAKYLFYLLNTSNAEYYYKSYAKKAINQCSISPKELEKIKFYIPSLSEQNCIVKLLELCDKEINLLQKELEQEKQKKKSLMQLLLTGIVRVKI